jgi:hypothetical protein
LTACALIAGVVLFNPHTAEAGARRPGIAGNLLIEDQDDLFVFPHLTAQYVNMISLAYGGSAGSGNGVLTLGDENMAFGVAVHRGDVQGPHLINELTALNGPATLFAPTFTADPATIVDLLLSTGDLGFRLGFGSGADITTVANNDSGENDFFIMGELGYGSGTRGQDTRMDLSAAITLDLAQAAAGGADTASAAGFGFSGLGRMYFPMDSSMDLGLLLNASISNRSINDETTDVTSSDMLLGLGGGLGPAFTFGAASVAAYGVLRFEYGSADPDTDGNDDETNSLTVVIPGVHMAAEVPLRDWLLFRTGAEYSFVMSGTSAPADNGSTTRSGVFGWNAGFGMIFDQLRFDGSIQHGFVTGGPDFIGGTAPGFLAIASMTYSFDEARRGSASSEPLEAEPQPLPMAAPPPAPVEPVPPPAPEPAPVAPMEGEAGASGDASGGASIGGSISTP